MSTSEMQEVQDDIHKILKEQQQLGHREHDDGHVNGVNGNGPVDHEHHNGHQDEVDGGGHSKAREENHADVTTNGGDDGVHDAHVKGQETESAAPDHEKGVADEAEEDHRNGNEEAHPAEHKEETEVRVEDHPTEHKVEAEVETHQPAEHKEEAEVEAHPTEHKVEAEVETHHPAEHKLEAAVEAHPTEHKTEAEVETHHAAEHKVEAEHKGEAAVEAHPAERHSKEAEVEAHHPAGHKEEAAVEAHPAPAPVPAGRGEKAVARGHEPGREEAHDSFRAEDDTGETPVRELRQKYLGKRQSSLEMKREVESQSRPVINKAAMSTSVDEKSVREAYEDVRSDTTPTDWAVFKFEAQKIVCAATGEGFDSFRSHFTDDERAFGFIRIQMGDEMSKRQKFVFLTWVGPQVSVIRRAKMTIDKGLVKDIIKNFAVELQVESQSEINVDYIREQLARAGGANYGTGFRD
ncbi:Coactosin-like protein [Frankliniella fusca]|uniref:Coactosin-like protein n=1 Tax=Frankliniella fusca TaxID=407009 RepID=A0AAE1HZS6_9NEOP|nr:Coactosin-like protein [Frankliniella fusca]